MTLRHHRPEPPVTNEDLAELIIAVGEGILDSIQTTQEIIMSDQAHLDADVASLSTALSDIEAEIASIKAANPAADFSKLDALVAQAQATDAANAQPAAATTQPDPATAAPQSPVDSGAPPAPVGPVATDATTNPGPAPDPNAASTTELAAPVAVDPLPGTAVPSAPIE